MVEGEYRPLIEKTIAYPKDDDAFKNLCVLSVDYLLGEDTTGRNKENVPASKIPSTAGKLYTIPVIRAYTIALLEYKNEQLTELLDSGWTDTPEAGRVRDNLAAVSETSDAELYKDYTGFKEMMSKL
ncbi:MAG: hypothetical protein ACREGA_00175 [Candidatus Saccharimonadales bacterium]